MTPERAIALLASADDCEAPQRRSATAAMKIFLLVLAGLGAVLFLTGGVHFSFQFGDATASPVVQDLLAIQDATSTTNMVTTRHRVFILLRHASAIESHAGARVLRRKLPSAARLAADEFAHGREVIAAVPIKTMPGSTCRQAVLRLVARSETVYRNLADDAAAMHETWHAVRHFVVAAQAAMRSYSSDVQLCITAAPPADRGPVERIMTA
jgi:hypothetical protein